MLPSNNNSVYKFLIRNNTSRNEIPTGNKQYATKLRAIFGTFTTQR
jgi:hypothetical protein